MATPAQVAEHLGAEVRRARKRLDLSQAAAAQLAGVSERFVRAVEQGKDTVQLRQLVAVLDALGIELDARPRSQDARGAVRATGGDGG